MSRFQHFLSTPRGVLITALVVISIPFYIATLQAANNAREGCERLNASREAQFEYLQNDLTARKEIVNVDKQSIKLLSGPNASDRIYEKYGFRLNDQTIQQSLVQAQTRIASNQKFITNDMVSSQALLKSTQSYQVAPGDPRVDCSAAYPYPFPLNL